MKTPNVEVRKMNPFGIKYEQFYTEANSGTWSHWNCHTGEWKKGFVRFVEDHDGYQKTYQVIIGDKELVGQECWICAKDKKRWHSEFESAGFEVRYEKGGHKKPLKKEKSAGTGRKKPAAAKK